MIESREGIWMAPINGDGSLPFSFFTEARFYSSWRVSIITSSDTQPYWGVRGDKVGTVTHMLQWRVLKFREIK